MDDFARDYKIETLDEIQDNLNILEDVLQEIQNGESADLHLDELFRLLHSVKGNAKSADFLILSKGAHCVEDILLRVKNKEISFNGEILDILYLCQSSFLDAILKLKNNLEEDLVFDDLLNAINAFESSSNENIDKKKINILIVDDEEDIIEFLENIVQTKHDSIFMRAQNGSEALDLCKNKKFDVILSDFSMPVMNGGEFIHSLRHDIDNSINEKTPVLMITGHRPDLAVDKKTWEHVFFIKKPFDEKKINFVLNCALRLSKRGEL